MTRLMFPILIAGLVTAAAAQPQTSIFQIQPTPNPLTTNNELYAAAAVSTTDAWAVGQVALHWDGAEWSGVSTAVKGAVLNGIVAVASNDVWAAGDLDRLSTGQIRAVIEHWDGSVWTNAAIPRPGVSSFLTSMAAFGTNDVWAAGWFENSGETAIQPLFEHWDGTAWTVVPAHLNQTAVFINAISGLSSSDIWAVGYTESGSVDDPIALHWNGTQWTVFKPPVRGKGSNILYGVVALAPDNAWGVGLSTPQAPPAENATLTLVEHWDGTSWQIVSSPNVGPGSIFQSNRLFAVSALSPTDVWAAGSFFAANGSGSQSTLVEHWDGTSWTISPAPNLGSSDTLLGVATLDGTVWAVGTYFGGPAISSTLVLSAAGI